MSRPSIFICFLVCITCFFLSTSLTAQPFTIINGSFEGNISGWDGTAVDGRDNGAFQGTVAYQAINAAEDVVPGSGSAIFTAGAQACSLTQQLGLTASQQFLTLTAEVAWDGNWDYIYFGFYEEEVWDRMENASIDITESVPADTDGVLDDFHTVTLTGLLVDTGNPVRVFIGSSCSPYSGGAQILTGENASKFAIDYVRPIPPPPPLAAQNWELYE